MLHWCANGCNRSQQHATTCNRLCKRTEQVKSNKYILSRFVSFTRVCILGCIILLKYLRRACKVSQGANTLFKVCQVMQEPFEASLSTLVFMPCRVLKQRASLKRLWKLTTPETLLNRVLFPRIRPYQTLKLCSYFPNFWTSNLIKSSLPLSAISRTKKLPHNRSLRS